MRILFVHAHFDDYEFTASGLFELWRQKLGDDLNARVLVCTDGRAGHHVHDPGKTTQVRMAEQRASARIGKYEFQSLYLPDGTIPREACLLVTRDLLAALWKAIRDFEPDYLFCPPVPSDPFAGVHVDHIAVAEAVRKVAYMINVPHAFVEEYPATEGPAAPCKVPVILNTYDGYMAGSNHPDFLVDVEEVFEAIAQMTWCHQSQILEWLPWVGRHQMKTPRNFEAWKGELRDRFIRQNRELACSDHRAREAFMVTAWGEVPTRAQLLRDLPGIDQSCSAFPRLKVFEQAVHGSSQKETS